MPDHAHAEQAVLPPETPPKVQPDTTRPRRARWGRRLAFIALGLVIVLVGLAAAAPYLASTRPVWRYGLSTANSSLNGQLDLSGLSLSWGGPLELRGLRVVDPASREVLNVHRVSCSGGLWGLLTGGLNFGEVVVEKPTANLYVNQDNEISLVEALSPRKSSPPTDEPLPEIRGKLVLKDGKIAAARENGPTYTADGVNAQFAVDTLATITGELGLKLADGTPLNLEADLRELVSDGELKPAYAKGKLRLQSGGEVQVGPLTEFLTPGNRVDGTVRLTLDVNGTAEDLQADFSISAGGLQTADRAAQKAAPVNIGVDGKIQRRGDDLSGHAALSGDAGKADAKFQYRLTDQPPQVDANRIMAAALSGEPLTLPDFTLEASGGIDLARLGQAMPGLLNIREGQEITAGRLEISALSVQGGERPSAKASAEIKDVTATDGARTVRVEPITLGVDAAMQPGQGLQIGLAELRASFAEVTAKGDIANLQAKFRANLSRLLQEVGQIVDLGSLSLAGDVAGTVEVKRSGDSKDVEAQFNAEATGLKIAKSADAAATVNLAVAGQARRQGDKLSGQAKLTGDAGSAEVGLTYPLDGQPAKVDGQRVLAAVLRGESLTLPNFVLTAAGVIDLARLANAIPGILQIKPGQEITGGKLEIVDLSARGGEQPSAKGSLKLDQVTAVNAARTLTVEPITLGFDAALVGGQGLQIALAELRSSFAEVSAKGAASNISAGFKANLARLQDELGEIIDLGGFELAGDLSGTLELQQAGDDRVNLKVNADANGIRYAAGESEIDLPRAELRQEGHVVLDRSGAHSITSSGSLGLGQLSVDGAVVLQNDAQLEWSNLQAAGNGSEISADSAKLQSSMARIDATGIRLKTGASLEAGADLKASADLAKVMQVVAAVSGTEPPPAVAGQLGLDAKVATAAGKVTFNGKGGIDQLAVGAGEETIREERADFEFDGQLEDPKGLVTLNKFRVKSKPLTAEAGGTVADYKGECLLDLKGRYEASWEELTAILHELAPETAETIIVAGQSASEFEITGPMRKPNVAPQFRAVESDTKVGWASADLLGVGMGKANLTPTLTEGKLTIPMATIPAADGKVNVAGTIDFAPADPTLKVPGKLPLLENVAISEVFSSTVLGGINPIFENVAKVEGRVSMTVQDVDVPLGERIKTAGSGSGVLDLGQIRIQPTGITAELLALGGFAAEEAYPVQIGKVNLAIKNGRIYYDDLTLGFPNEFDLRFRGSVGLDGTLDLVISIPIREGMLQRLGVKGPTTEMLKQATNLRVDVPLSGTRENPKLDFSKVDVASLLKGLLPTSPDDVIKGLLDGLQPFEPPKVEPEKPSPKEPRREGRPPRERRQVRPRDQSKESPSEEPKEPTSQPRKRRATRRP